MNSNEDFIIPEPYQVTPEDKAAFAKASPKAYHYNNWMNNCLSGFKERLREDYYDKQNFRCAYCRLELHPELYTPEIDHIVPKSLKSEWMYYPFNMCVTCKSCNTKKGKKKVLKDDNIVDMPTDSDAYLIVHPHIDKYSEHIRLVDDILYQGISKKGKNTIQKCVLYRYDLAARRAAELILHSQLTYTTFLLALVDEKHKKLIDKYDMFERRVNQIIKHYKEAKMV